MFSQNLKHGIGRYHHKSDGAVYTGHFESGLREGIGQLENEELLYIGSWKQNMRHGEGYEFTRDGRVYLGE